ncbi:MAG: hypothetical protein ABIQ88_02430 [Chitinophagaceae bacterium]
MKFLISAILLLSGTPGFCRQVTATVISGQVDAANAQTVYSLVPGDTLVIPSTATAYLHLGNIVGTAAGHITVINSGRIVTAGAFSYFELTGTLQYVDFIFTDVATSYGMYINNASYRAMTCVNATIQDCKFKGIEIRNPADYAIYFNHNRTYDGTAASLNKNISFDHFKITKCGATTPVQLGFSGGNYMDSVTINDFTIDSVNSGVVFQMEWVFHTKIYNCSITNTGLTAFAHSAVFFVRGDADIRNNFIYNFWGNGYRAFGISLVPSKGSPMGVCSFTNNVVINSRKYGAVEVNTQPGDTGSSYIRPVNYYIQNNTVGQLNAADYYNTSGSAGGGGAAFDIYFAIGFCRIWNNIYFNCYRDKGQGIGGVNYLWHDGNFTSTPDTANNLYSTDGIALLTDTITGAVRFPSLAVVPGGVTIPAIATDKAGVARSAPYTVGAFQYFTPFVPVTTLQTVIRGKRIINQ